MKNWKTTLAGCVTAMLYAVLSALQAGTVEPKDLVIAGGMAAIGALAKDLNVTGGTVNQ
jgi:hypothetical protein